MQPSDPRPNGRPVPSGQSSSAATASRKQRRFRWARRPPSRRVRCRLHVRHHLSPRGLCPSVYTPWAAIPPPGTPQTAQSPRRLRATRMSVSDSSALLACENSLANHQSLFSHCTPPSHFRSHVPPLHELLERVHRAVWLVAGHSGLAYLGLGIGMFGGVVVQATLGEAMLKARAAKSGGRSRAEDRLQFMAYMSPALPAGLFWYGWSVDKQTHWIVPIPRHRACWRGHRVHLEMKKFHPSSR